MFTEINGLTVLTEEAQTEETIVEIDLPYNYSPYPFQKKAWTAKEEGYRNFIFVWHRRAGKDKTLWNMFISFIVSEWDSPGIYFYCLPTATQARKVIWNGIDNDGFRFMDHIPAELIANKTKQEMTIELTNGTIIQLVGSDNYDRLVGSNPKGMCFSEYSVGNPLGYEYMRPALKANNGWALFPYTPRGKNHGHTLIQGAKRLNAHQVSKGKQPRWFIQVETVDTTTRHDGEPILTEEDIEEERLLGMSEDHIQQEYYCSFDAAVMGAIYGEQMRKVHNENRITFMPVDPTLPVFVSADIGFRDHACWWFIQFKGEQIRLVHYYENQLKGTEHYINYISEFKQTHNVRIDTVILPHDAKHTNMNATITVEDKFKKARFKVAIAPNPLKINRETGIQQVRALFNHFVFDEAETEIGVSALTGYVRKYDDVLKVFSKEPLHSWHSNGADALRTFATWYNVERPQHQKRRTAPRKASSGYKRGR